MRKTRQVPPQNMPAPRDLFDEMSQQPVRTGDPDVDIQALIYGGGFDTETQDPAAHTPRDPWTHSQNLGTDIGEEPLWDADATQQATTAHPDGEDEDEADTLGPDQTVATIGGAKPKGESHRTSNFTDKEDELVCIC